MTDETLYDDYLSHFPFILPHDECHYIVPIGDGYFKCLNCCDTSLSADSYMDYCKDWFDYGDEESLMYNYPEMKRSHSRLHAEFFEFIKKTIRLSVDWRISYASCNLIMEYYH